MIELEFRMDARPQRVIGDHAVVPTAFDRQVIDRRRVDVDDAAKTGAAKRRDFEGVLSVRIRRGDRQEQEEEREQDTFHVRKLREMESWGERISIVRGSLSGGS